jgi:hypothetical protein
MVRMIKVCSDDDYGALAFERSDITVKDVFDMFDGNYNGEYERTTNSEVKFTVSVDNEYDEEIYAELYEFEGEIDKEFISFVRNVIQDEYDSNFLNFYFENLYL